MNYLIESSISMMLLYGLYFFVFRQFTFIRLNRIYLLLSLAFSLLIPTLRWQMPIAALGSTSITTGLYSFDNYKAFGNIPLNNPMHEVSNNFEWFVIIQWVYVIGFVLMIARLFILIYRIFTINRTPSKPYIANTGKMANASFFNLIFIDDRQLEAHEVEQILTHERWHIRLLHSYDLLFVELLKAVYWFNPIVWLYQRSLTEVHEYEVDSKMIEQYNPQDYAHLLLKLAGLHTQPMIFHQFSRKPLSARIHFLFTKQKSIPMKKYAYLSVLPLVGVLIMAFSFEKEREEVGKSLDTGLKVIENSYFKAYPEIKVFENKSIMTLTTNEKNDRIGITLNPNKITPELINGAVANYFKEYGFELKAVDAQYNNFQKLLRLEIILEETQENKKSRDISKNIMSALPTRFSFNLSEMISKNPKDLDALITIFADKTTGEHFVVPLAPPTLPDVTPYNLYQEQLQKTRIKKFLTPSFTPFIYSKENGC